jgi:O-antigen ligase
MHPGYLAMYANTALILCLYDIRLSQSTRRKLRRAFQAIVLVLFVVLLYSKAGLAAMSLIILAFAMRWAWFQKKWQVLALSFVGMIGFFAVIYFYVPNTQLRLQTILASQKIENHNPLSTESTQTRIHAWKAARKVIAEKPVFGHGTGDAMDVLFTKYDELGYVGVRTIEMNAHNEFYQTGIALGFVGMGVLIMVFISGIYISYRRRNFAVGLWSICMALAMAFESYLNTQAGVVLLALFMTYFSLFNCDDRKA